MVFSNSVLFLAQSKKAVHEHSVSMFADNVRQSKCLNEEVFMTLDKMEALQNMVRIIILMFAYNMTPVQLRQSNCDADSSIFSYKIGVNSLFQRAQKWAERMDAMGLERLHLAQMLMETLDAIERESGIFLIKPMYSYKGKYVFDMFYFVQ